MLCSLSSSLLLLLLSLRNEYKYIQLKSIPFIFLSSEGFTVCTHSTSSNPGPHISSGKILPAKMFKGGKWEETGSRR